MRIGVFAKTFPGSDPATVLAQSKAAGFEGVQYNMACSGLPSMPDAISPDITRAVAQAAKETGQQIMALSGTYNMIHPDLAVRRVGERRLAVIAGIDHLWHALGRRRRLRCRRRRCRFHLG
jgi:sugar phosphate isomerase/epimerase